MGYTVSLIELADATEVAVLTGAGLSAESGIPPEELPTAEAFTWEWYDRRRALIAKAVPNAAHKALVRLEIAKPRFTLITETVDGLHEMAGSGKILKLRGDMWRLQCLACGANFPNRRVPLPKIPPHCACGGEARPVVVWCGEAVPEGLLKEAEHAVSSAEVLLVIGRPATNLKPGGARVIEVEGSAAEVVPQLI